MGQIIEVPGMGQIEFPDGMKDAEIVSAIKNLQMQPKEQTAAPASAVDPNSWQGKAMATETNPVQLAVGAIPDSIRKPVEGVVNTIGTGLTKGFTGMLGAPDALGTMADKGASYLGDKLGMPEFGKNLGAALKSNLTFNGLAPSQEGLNNAIFGGLRVPEQNAGDNPALTLTPPALNGGKINVGKMIDSGIQAIPGALTLGGGALPAFMGGVTSEMGGQAAAGTPYEIPARVAGAIPGALLGSKLTTPLPANLSAEEQRLVDLAKEKGVPLTVGQETGRGRGIESAVARFPTSQGRMAEFADTQQRAINKDALAQVGAVGDRVDPTTMNGVIRNASADFEAAKNASGNVRLDKPFFEKLLSEVGQYMENTPASSRAPVVSNRAQDFVNAAPELTGAQYQEFRRSLNTAAMKTSDSGVRNALKGMRSGLDDAMEASLPADQAAAWHEVRKNWANLKTLTKAAAGGSMDSRNTGNLSPSALSMALRSSQGADRFSSTTGGLNDTARVASYLADTRPNSGTPQTLMMQGALTGGPIAAGYAAGGIPGAGMAATGMAIPNVIARAMTGTGGMGAGWLRNYLANQAAPNTLGFSVDSLPAAVTPGFSVMAPSYPRLERRQ